MGLGAEGVPTGQEHLLPVQKPHMSSSFFRGRHSREKVLTETKTHKLCFQAFDYFMSKYKAMGIFNG